MKITTLIPAYGRDYTSKKAVMEDFRQNKDFILADSNSRWDGKPTHRMDCIEGGYTHVYVRYGRLRRVMIIDMRKEALI